MLPSRIPVVPPTDVFEECLHQAAENRSVLDRVLAFFRTMRQCVNSTVLLFSQQPVVNSH